MLETKTSDGDGGWGYDQISVVSPGIFLFQSPGCLAFLWLASLLLPCEALAGSYDG